MFRRGNLGSVLMAVFLAEIVLFVVVVERIGFGTALLLSVASSCFGLLRLQRSGQSAFAALSRISEVGLSGPGSFIDGFLGTLGGLFLVLPGFLTDLIGLFLVAPAGRRWLIRRFGPSLDDVPGTARARSGPQIIDLGQDDWSRIDKQRLR